MSTETHHLSKSNSGRAKREQKRGMPQNTGIAMDEEAKRHVRSGGRYQRKEVRRLIGDEIEVWRGLRNAECKLQVPISTRGEGG
jgi:hypothetical protein